MKRAIALTILSVSLFVYALTTGCGTTKVEAGSGYTPTNSVGEVVTDDTPLAIADMSYKFAYDTTFAAFKFERDNRQALKDLDPDIKAQMDKARIAVQGIEVRWANARKVYRQNPTPAGMSAIQTILAEMQRILPAVQTQMSTGVAKLAKRQTTTKP